MKGFRLIIFGPPGSGKGTYSKLISDQYRIPHVSTGDLLREHLKLGSELGRMAETFMDRGEYVPDDVVNRVVFERVESDACKSGFILDGYPRTMGQVEALEVFLSDKGWRIDLVLNIVVSEDEAVKRLSSRRICSKCDAVYNLINVRPKVDGVCDRCGGALYHRDDDTPQVVRERLKLYVRDTEPLLKYYRRRRKVVDIDGHGEVSVVSDRIRAILDGFRG